MNVIGIFLTNRDKYVLVGYIASELTPIDEKKTA